MTVFSTKPPQLLQPNVPRYDSLGRPTKDQVTYENNLQQFLINFVNATAAQFNPMLAAWTAYTPVVTAGTGAFTTVSATGRYLSIGKTVFVQIVITETNVGTAASYVLATLPKTAASNAVLAGRENALTGKELQGIVIGNPVVILNYDNSAPIGNGYVLYLSGVYEST
jgi:hypothetical protein